MRGAGKLAGVALALEVRMREDTRARIRALETSSCPLTDNEELYLIARRLCERLNLTPSNDYAYRAAWEAAETCWRRMTDILDADMQRLADAREGGA